MESPRQLSYRTAMAHAELGMTIGSSLLVIAACAVVARAFWPTVTLNMSFAFGIALLGLWWREFVRQMRFAVLRYGNALKLDVIYVSITVLAASYLLVDSRVSTTSVLWCMALGGVASAAPPLVSAIRAFPVSPSAVRQDVFFSWNIGRWEVLSSVVSWTYAQSYVYFAALQGGLDAAAEISAARLLAMPLSLLWTSYANVLRPSASRLIATGTNLDIRRLVLRSALFVIASSLVYALLIYAALPLLEHSLFAGKFRNLWSLTIWWVAYFMLTGITTVASSVLRSALEFRQVFYRQALSCVAAVVLLTIGLRLNAIESLVIALVIVEFISAGLFWHRLSTTVSLRHKSA